MVPWAQLGPLDAFTTTSGITLTISSLRKPTESRLKNSNPVNTQKQSIFFFFYLIRVSSSIRHLRAPLKFALNSPKSSCQLRYHKCQAQKYRNRPCQVGNCWLYAFVFYPIQTLKIHNTLLNQLRKLFAKFFPRKISRYKT